MAAGSFLSMGYGFVEFKNRKEALNAVKQLQVPYCLTNNYSIKQVPTFLAHAYKFLLDKVRNSHKF